MNNKTDKLLEELLGEIKDKSDFDDVRDALFKRGIQSLLNAEMTAHLGYQKGELPLSSNIRNGYSKKTIKTQQGEHRIEVPRDRDAEFDPVIVEKHKSISSDLEGSVNLLYAKGMSNSDIVDFMEHTYGVKYSTSQISIITNEVLEDIKIWQQRPLQDQYAVIWMDGIHYKVRDEGKVVSKAIMITLGIDMEGKQDILSITVVRNESATEWMSIMDDLKCRGVQDILFLCSDNLKGLKKGVEAIYPQSIHQICIVHQIRNSLKYVSYKDRKSIMKDIKEIYRANNEPMAREAFERFKEKWQGQYEKSVKSWEQNWEHLTAFLAYPQQIRQLIYTTNIIESFNASLRKYTRNKKVFPTDDAALKSVYLAASQITKKWQKSRRGWGQVYNQLYIHFEERLV
jgi:transposase-like protein